MNLLSLLVLIVAALACFYQGASRVDPRRSHWGWVGVGLFIVGLILQFTLYPHDIVGRL